MSWSLIGEQVHANGYFSFSRNQENVSSSNDDLDYIVVPFWTNNAVMNISYEVHTITSNPSILSRVSKFIRQQKENSFAGRWMMVAEWKNNTLSSQSNGYVSHKTLIDYYSDHFW